MSKEKELLTRFLVAPEQQVFDLFTALPGAIFDEHLNYCYIEGKREDRILLVAHADTVRTRAIADPGADVRWLGDVAVGLNHCMFALDARPGYHGSQWNGAAIGADDRAGCAMMYDLFDGQHSVLITSGEETGLTGAKSAVAQIGDKLKKHVFAVEVDRQGDRQMVFYDVSTDAFEEYVLARFSHHDIEGAPWKKERGSSSDIKYICGELRICGVNLAAGYIDQHTGNEALYLGAWLHTRAALKRFLKEAKHEVYVLPKKKIVVEDWEEWRRNRGAPYVGPQSGDSQGFGNGSGAKHDLPLRRQSPIVEHKAGVGTTLLLGVGGAREKMFIPESTGKKRGGKLLKRILTLGKKGTIDRMTEVQTLNILLRRCSPTCLATPAFQELKRSRDALWRSIFYLEGRSEQTNTPVGTTGAANISTEISTAKDPWQLDVVLSTEGEITKSVAIGLSIGIYPCAKCHSSRHTTPWHTKHIDEVVKTPVTKDMVRREIDRHVDTAATEPRIVMVCIHYCKECMAPWSHERITPGCKYGHDTQCPEHSSTVSPVKTLAGVRYRSPLRWEDGPTGLDSAVPLRNH